VNDFYVYVYIDPRDDLPFYIGKGRGKRDAQHLRPWDLKIRRPFYYKLKRMLAEGVQPIVSRLAESLCEAEAFSLESFLILALGRRLDSKNPGPLWNLTDGGEGASGNTKTETTKQKIREARKHQVIVITETTRRKISLSNKGKRRTAEVRRQMCESRKGSTLSEQHRQKIGSAHKGTKCAESTRQKISLAHKGRTHTDVSRHNMSESHKGKSPGEVTRQRLSAALKGRKRTESERSAIVIGLGLRYFRDVVPHLATLPIEVASWPVMNFSSD
jgi:hypothetical protein